MKAESPEIEEEGEEMEKVEMDGVPVAPVAQVPELTVPTSGGVKIIFKNAKIYAEKVIIKKK